MKMKKILSAAAVLAIVASLGVTASADTTINGDKVTIPKSYTVTGPTAVNPADELKFEVQSATFQNGSVTGTAEVASIENVDVTKNVNSANIEVQLPEYTKAGIYTYKIVEKKGSVVGVDYRENPFYLVVTVTNGNNGGFDVAYATVYDSNEKGDKADSKLDEIVNAYTAGSLKITEETKGTLSNSDKEFTETVTFKVPDGVKAQDVVTVTVNGAEYKWTDDNTVVITVNNGDTITFGNLPKGTTYNVTETEQDGYKPGTKFDDTTKTITGGEEDKVTITNEKDAVADTGINLDNLPYALTLAGVAAIGGVVAIRRRRVND